MAVACCLSAVTAFVTIRQSWTALASRGETRTDPSSREVEAKILAAERRIVSQILRGSCSGRAG